MEAPDDDAGPAGPPGPDRPPADDAKAQRARARRARRARARPAGEAPDLTESLRRIGDTGRAGFSAAGDAAKAFRSLVTADISLARSAFGRTLALTGVAIVFGASGWLLLMAALIVFLTRQLGMPWVGSLLLCAVLSAAVAAWASWQAQRYFEHTRMQATRRQLARLGIGELADFTPEPGSPTATRDVTENAPPEHADGEPMKDERGVDVTPP